MLCIALVAVFALDGAEAATPCSNADCTSACDLGACDDQDEHGTPCVQHHCCHGTAALEANAPAATSLRTMMRLVATMHDEPIATRALAGLERPPRTSTVL